MRLFLAVLAVMVVSIIAADGASMNIPSDFPSFSVPGHEKEMASLRELYWLHYPASGPKATLWDTWLPMPSLWPDTSSSDSMRRQWNDVLSARIMDRDGYVSTHQHPSIAHPLGWPFPFWPQGTGSYGWHFSFKDTVGPPWRPDSLSGKDDWTVSGAADLGIGEDGWNLKLEAPNAYVTAPKHEIDTLNAPFLQLRWRATGLGNVQPYIEWTTSDEPSFSADRRFYFDPVESAPTFHTVIPIYKHPKWKGTITRLRVNFGNSQPGAPVTIQALFTQYDTRQDINSQLFIRGCDTYFAWTRDINFLRRNIGRMRMALRFVMTEHQALEHKYVYNTWVGHDGISGIKISPDGKKTLLSGHGVGDNYYDLLPGGHKDGYSTMLYYESLICMAQIERDILAHPEWNVDRGALALDSDTLLKHAAEVKRVGNKLFWNDKTGRFILNIDAEGKTHDYGFTFMNTEAVYYDFATAEHAKKIMDWISGKRTVEGDTSQGADIYHWRCAPRCTTKRNIDYYVWPWSGPETIPWGSQIQDGGAVLGFSYHDMMARLKVYGPDSAWERLKEITKWFAEVQAAGGYRKYYDGTREGTLQGGGPPGGLGMDQEFFESVLVPQVMLDGFMGFSPKPDGFAISPRLPSEWPELTVDRIRFHDLTLRIRATHDSVEVFKDAGVGAKLLVYLPGKWKAEYIDAPGKTLDRDGVAVGAFGVDLRATTGVRFSR